MEPQLRDSLTDALAGTHTRTRTYCTRRLLCPISLFLSLSRALALSLNPLDLFFLFARSLSPLRPPNACTL
jgi:hypothetical protein